MKLTQTKISNMVKSLALTTILLLIFNSRAMAQIAEVKINVASAAVAIVNPSLEVGFAERSAITFDYVGAFAEENYMGTGYPFVLSMGTFGYRYYTGKSNNHKGFFVGSDFGLFAFRMNKNVVPLVTSDDGKYGCQVGYGYLIGFTAGYKYPISKRFNVEASLSAGWQLSQHERYDADGVRQFTLNPSAEWLPYKAGIYLNYSLW